MTAGPPQRPETVAIRVGRGAGRPGDPVNPPVTFATVFHEEDGRLGYAREGNPTWVALEEVLGALEGGEAVAFSSGIAAIDATLALVPDGSAVVAPHDAYAGTRALLDDAGRRGRLEPRLVDVADTDATLEACRGAGLLFLESPTNPMMAIPDLAALAAGAREQGLLVAVDNTFATPLRQRPLALGADVAVHSASKLLSGHSDVVLGAAVTADAGLADRLREYRTLRGAIPGPMEAWLVLRGVRSLPVRLDRAEANAQELARRFRDHRAVVAVRYPGLADDPGHERAARQTTGPGTMLAVELADAAVADAFCAAVQVAVHVTSLGGIETSLERRARQPLEAHVPPGLVRISIGCEHVEDLWADLEAALETAVRVVPASGDVEPRR